MLLVLFLLFTPLLFALRVPLVARQGPSGSLNYPTGGTYIYSNGGKNFIAISYNQVNQPNAVTYGIDITLEPFNGNTQPAVQIARGLTANISDPITGYFATLNSCGEFRVVITERQIYDGNPISFRAAAPKILIDCVPHA